MPEAGRDSDLILHASCVAVEGAAALIRGAAGSGKSTLALTLMAFGARLVADDRVRLRAVEGGIEASAPPTISGLIEARGVGILRADPCARVRLCCVVDLDQFETDRVPLRRKTDLLGQSLDLLYRVEGPHFAPAIYQYLSAGRRDPS